MLRAPPQAPRASRRPPPPRCSPAAAGPPPPPPSAGGIRRLVLTPEGRAKLDARPDRDFYAFPRLVKHVDDGFLAALTDLYRDRLRPGWDVLDLMSSWVSHLPPELTLRRVVGHGLNAQELAKNPRLDYFFVKDLNKEQQLELETSSFDAVLCTVSVQYLQSPEKVFAEIFRVLKPGGVCIVSFSNRMFYEKAIGAWREGTAYSRVQLVTQYFQCVDGFTQPEVVRKLPSDAAGGKPASPLDAVMRLFGMAGSSDPFYAVISYRNFKPM
uniref:Methyltransferase type 11 domain-containing protein n=1 Tax=Oryza punctata TaxID=4537 RepID=A0A0E0KRZ1_ORYPU